MCEQDSLFEEPRKSLLRTRPGGLLVLSIEKFLRDAITEEPVPVHAVLAAGFLLIAERIEEMRITP